MWWSAQGTYDQNLAAAVPLSLQSTSLVLSESGVQAGEDVADERQQLAMVEAHPERTFVVEHLVRAGADAGDGIGHVGTPERLVELAVRLQVAENTSHLVEVPERRHHVDEGDRDRCGLVQIVTLQQSDGVRAQHVERGRSIATAKNAAVASIGLVLT